MFEVTQREQKVARFVEDALKNTRHQGVMKDILLWLEDNGVKSTEKLFQQLSVGTIPSWEIERVESMVQVVPNDLKNIKFQSDNYLTINAETVPSIKVGWKLTKVGNQDVDTREQFKEYVKDITSEEVELTFQVPEHEKIMADVEEEEKRMADAENSWMSWILSWAGISPWTAQE